MSEILDVVDVSLGYGEQSVLQDVNLRLAKGEICGIIGPNGAGKTSLLKAILDLEVWWKGRISVSGKDNRSLTRMERARLVSYVPQSYSQGAELTVEESVLLGRYPHRKPWSKDSRADLALAARCMESTDTWRLRSRLFTQLSGGEKRLVLIASALAQEPSLLLLDEPAAALDFRHQVELWLLLQQLASQGLTILLSTHEIGIASGFLSSIMVLAESRCVASGRPDQVLRSDLLSEVFGLRLSVTRHPEGSYVVLPKME